MKPRLLSLGLIFIMGQASATSLPPNAESTEPKLIASFTWYYNSIDTVAACLIYEDAMKLLFKSGSRSIRKPTQTWVDDADFDLLDKLVTEAASTITTPEPFPGCGFGGIPEFEERKILGIQYKDTDFVMAKANSKLGRHVQKICGFVNEL